MATLRGQGHGHELQGTWDEARGTRDLHQSIPPPASPRQRTTQSPLSSPNLSRCCHPAPGVGGGVQIQPPHLPLRRERRWQGRSAAGQQARVHPAQLRLVTICRSLFFFSINLVGSRLVALRTLPRGTSRSHGKGTHSLAVADFGELHEPLLGCP